MSDANVKDGRAVENTLKFTQTKTHYDPIQPGHMGDRSSPLVRIEAPIYASGGEAGRGGGGTGVRVLKRGTRRLHWQYGVSATNEDLLDVCGAAGYVSGDREVGHPSL